MIKQLVIGAKSNKKRALLVLFNIAGLIAVITTSSVEVVAKINPLHIIWFIPVCILAASLGIKLGLKINNRGSSNER